MGTETDVAHCGACGGIMVMVIDGVAVWFVCLDCGEETTPRQTAAEADQDVVWVPLRHAERKVRT